MDKNVGIINCKSSVDLIRGELSSSSINKNISLYLEERI